MIHQHKIQIKPVSNAGVERHSSSQIQKTNQAHLSPSIVLTDVQTINLRIAIAGENFFVSCLGEPTILTNIFPRNESKRRRANRYELMGRIADLHGWIEDAGSRRESEETITGQLFDVLVSCMSADSSTVAPNSCV